MSGCDSSTRQLCLFWQRDSSDSNTLKAACEVMQLHDRCVTVEQWVLPPLLPQARVALQRHTSNSCPLVLCLLPLTLVLELPAPVFTPTISSLYSCYLPP